MNFVGGTSSGDIRASTFLRALAGETLQPAPIWIMRQAGRYLPEYREIRAKAGSFLDLCFKPELAAEVTLQPIRRFGLDAAILFSDILVVPYALGQKLDFVDGEGPRLDPLEDAAGVDGLNRDGAMGRLDPVFETVRRVREGLPLDRALIGFCGAPWTVATYMIGGRGSPEQAVARLFAYRDPETMAALIETLVGTSADYLSAQVAAGVNALQIFESWGGNLPDDEFARWSIAPTKALVAKVKARHPRIPIIGFPRAAGQKAERYVADTGVDAVGIDTSAPLGWVRERLQSRVAVQGNLDPLLLLAGGDVLDARIDAILDALGDGPFVFNLGHGILPTTPPENVGRLVARVRQRKAPASRC